MADDVVDAEIRALLQAHPELTMADITSDLLRNQPADDPYARPSVALALSVAAGSADRFWDFLTEHDPATAEALMDTTLVSRIIEIARQELR